LKPLAFIDVVACTSLQLYIVYVLLVAKNIEQLEQGHLGVSEKIRNLASEALDRLIDFLAFRLYSLKISSILVESFIFRVVFGMNVCCNLVNLG
jgi:hypothetical protein